MSSPAVPSSGAAVPTLDTLAAGKYLSLTTFRRDGTPVATPVWLVRDGQALFVITQAGSGKAKRIRNDGRVLLAACDSRGRLRSAQVPGTAELQDPAATALTRRLILQRYGLLGRLILRGSTEGRVGIRIAMVTPE